MMPTSGAAPSDAIVMRIPICFDTEESPIVYSDDLLVERAGATVINILILDPVLFDERVKKASGS